MDRALVTGLADPAEQTEWVLDDLAERGVPVDVAEAGLGGTLGEVSWEVLQAGTAGVRGSASAGGGRPCSPRPTREPTTRAWPCSWRRLSSRWSRSATSRMRARIPWTGRCESRERRWMSTWSRSRTTARASSRRDSRRPSAQRWRSSARARTPTATRPTLRSTSTRGRGDGPADGPVRDVRAGGAGGTARGRGVRCRLSVAA
ncbi:hypothetical protein NKG05_24960 [Oerskovia sp. M15]